MKDYYLKPSGNQRTAYLEYLLKRLTDFRRAGSSYGQKHQAEISVHVTRKIIQSQLGWPLLDESHFAETCAHIQAKIHDTILGRRNAARGTRSYHSFEDHGKPKADAAAPASQNGAAEKFSGQTAPEVAVSFKTPSTCPARPTFLLKTHKAAPPSPADAQSRSQPASGMNTYTATEIAIRSGSISRQGVAKLLGSLTPDAVRVARGNQETSAWSYSTIARCEKLLRRLEADARRQHYRNAKTMLASPLQPSTRIELRDIADDELSKAAKLRDLLAPFLRDQSKPASERDALIAARYRDAFGHVITADYARKLFQRTLSRDAGLRDYGRLEIFLPDNPKRKQAPEWTATTSNLADMLPALESRLAGISSTNPPKAVVRSVWHVAFEEYSRLISQGATEDRAARMTRNFLHARAPFLPRNRDTLLKSWNEKLSRWLAREGMPGALVDLRCNNGREVSFPEADVSLMRHSLMTKHSGLTRTGDVYARFDSAWRGEYDRLSEATRKLGTKEGRCPRPFVRAINRVTVTGLAARRHGRRSLEKLLGTVKCNSEMLPAMHTWVLDDMTCNIECYSRTHDGTASLFQPQLIGVYDVGAGKFVGWAISQDKGPTGELAYEAFCDAVRRTGKVPHRVGLENGWVFGRSSNIVGKRDEFGDVIIAGLAEFGCEVFHYTPGNPTSKGEIEKAFDMLQRRMEPHPGFTGREQRHDAPEQFRREQIEMRRRSKPRDPATCRYDFPQGIRAIEKIINDYNATPNHGALKGLTPDAAFVAFQDPNNPPITLSARLHWMLFPRRRVTVKHNGVGPFSLFGIEIRVRGGNLVNHVGEELWAVVDNRAADCVTFMSLDFSDVFTEPLRPIVDKYQSQTDPESDALETEYETKAAHRSVIEDQYQGLISRFGDPRTELLRQAQEETRIAAATIGAGRISVVDPNYAAAGEAGERQRTELRKRIQSAEHNQQTPAPTRAIASRPGYEEARNKTLGKKTT